MRMRVSASNVWLSVIGSISMLYGIFSAILASNGLWFSIFAIGALLFFGSINFRLKIDSVFTDLISNPRWVLFCFVAYVIAAVGIELVLRFWLGYVNYPSLSISDQIVHLLLIQYTIGFFYIYEFFVLVRTQVKSFISALLVAAVINGSVVEYLNTFNWEWRYHIPFSTIEILQVNVVAIFGWIVMALIPIGLRYSVDTFRQSRRPS